MEKTLLEAQRYVFLLLKYRLRTQDELETKLRQKGYSSKVIKESLDFFANLGYLDDSKFAQLWISSRIRSKPRSKRFFEYELKRKGVAKDIIMQAIAAIDDEKEYSIAKDAAARKYRKVCKLEPAVAKRRLAGFLARRGFNSYIVFKIIKEVVSENEE